MSFKLPNPLPPSAMSPLERRAEICRLLAAGLVRLHLREQQKAAAAGGSSLHISSQQSGSPVEPDRRTA